MKLFNFLVILHFLYEWKIAPLFVNGENRSLDNNCIIVIN